MLFLFIKTPKIMWHNAVHRLKKILINIDLHVQYKYIHTVIMWIRKLNCSKSHLILFKIKLYWRWIFVELMHLQCNIFTKKRNAGCFRLHPLLTFLACAVFFPSPHDADVGEKRLLDQPKECLCVMQGAFYASLLSLSLSFIFLKLFLYTQSVVCVLYQVHVLYSVRSFWSSFSTKSEFYTQSTVRDPQSPVRVLYWPVQRTPP